jgi:hypothetical protein
MPAFEVYLDEAGYTGPDLLNPDQPVYTLASVALSPEVAQDLKARCFASVKARELHHSALIRRPRGRQQIVDFIHALAEYPDSATVTVAHKPYVLLGLLVDYWPEPAMRLDGINLYERGANIGLVNVTYIVLGAVLGEEGRREFLRRFQVMVRDRTAFACESFWGTVRDLCREHPNFDDTFGIYEAANLRLGRDHLWGLPHDLLDLGEYGLLQTVSHWRGKTVEPLRLVHDNNTSLARHRELWDVWLSPDAPAAVMGQDRRVTRFPLNGTIELADSVTHVPLQLADLVAGATATMLNPRAGRAPKHPDYVEALRKSPLLEHCAIGGVWPSDKVRPEDLETDGPVYGDTAEYMTSLVVRAREGRQ